MNTAKYTNSSQFLDKEDRDAMLESHVKDAFAYGKKIRKMVVGHRVLIDLKQERELRADTFRL